jgi:hypothetical protein
MKSDGELSPRQRALRSRISSLAGRIAANKRVAQADYDGRAATRPASEAYWLRLDSEVDPRGELEPSVRREKAKKLWQSRMLEGQLRRAQKALRKAS